MEQEVFYVGGKKLNVTVKVQINKGFCKKEKKTTMRSHDWYTDSW